MKKETETMKKFIVGNWKMNGTQSTATALAGGIAQGLQQEPGLAQKADFCVCPPFAHIATVRQALPVAVHVGGQDCSAQPNGAFTGEVSSEMLLDLGCGYVILGHSERRQYHGESDADVAAKAAKAHQDGLKTIICVGETDAERQAGKAESVVSQQLKAGIPASATAQNLVIAYEPVWSIGTGKTPSPEDVKAIHKVIRENLKEKLDNSAAVRILYGGSVKPENAKTLLTIDNVDGALIGGASLKAEQYLAIAREAVA